MKIKILLICLLVATFTGKLFAQTTEPGNTTASDSLTTPLLFAEVMPEFPGGQEQMYKFLYSQLRYPPEARKSGIEGKVFVRFTVTADGSITDVTLGKPANDLLAAEAMRVIKLMPKWKPATTQKGTPVSISMMLPVQFSLK